MRHQKPFLEETRVKLCILVISCTLDTMAMAMMLPVQVTLMQEVGLTTIHLGYIQSGYAFCSALIAPAIGRLSDDYGRVTILRYGALGSALGLMGARLAPGPLWMAVARILPGLCRCHAIVAQAYINDVSSSKDRASNMGLIGLSFGMAFSTCRTTLWRRAYSSCQCRRRMRLVLA